MFDGISRRSTTRRRLGEVAVVVLLLAGLAILARPTKTPPPLTPEELRRQAQAAAWLAQVRDVGTELVTSAPAAFAEQQRAGHPYTVYKDLKQIASDIEKLGALQAEFEALREREGTRKENDERMAEIDEEIDVTLERIEKI